MSRVGLSDDLHDDDALLALLLGLTRELERWRGWQDTLENSEANAGVAPDSDFLHCLLGVAALAKSLSPALQAWSERDDSAARDSEPARPAWGLFR